MESETESPAVNGLRDNMAVVAVLGTVPWLLSMLGQVPGAVGSYSRFMNWCSRELKAKRQVGILMAEVFIY